MSTTIERSDGPPCTRCGEPQWVTTITREDAPTTPSGAVNEFGRAYSVLSGTRSTVHHECKVQPPTDAERARQLAITMRGCATTMTTEALATIILAELSAVRMLATNEARDDGPEEDRIEDWCLHRPRCTSFAEHAAKITAWEKGVLGDPKICATCKRAHVAGVWWPRHPFKPMQVSGVDPGQREHVWKDDGGNVSTLAGHCAACGLTRAFAGPWFEYTRGDRYLGVISPAPPCDVAWPVTNQR